MLENPKAADELRLLLVERRKAENAGIGGALPVALAPGAALAA